MPNSCGTKKSLEVLLINPPSSKGEGGRGQFFTPPMGLCYLSSYLQCKGISVDIIDCDPEEVYIDYFSPSEVQEQQLAKLLCSYDKPLIVGIGPCTTPFLFNSLAVARFVKAYFNNTYVVIGGPHPSISPPSMAVKMLQKFNYIDAICINEGEKTLFELVNKLKSQDYSETIEGLVFQSKENLLFKERNLMDSHELDSMPFPNRNLLEKYSTRYRLAVRRNFVRILSDSHLIQKYGKNPKFTVIFSSRGCPYQCTFCGSLSYRRLRSPENVVREIEFCAKNYDIHCFVFYDDLFTTSSSHEIDRVKSICNLLIEHRIEAFWEVELRADVICNLEQEVLSLMNQAGCCTVNIGIEKATDEGLRWLCKGQEVKQIQRAIRVLRECGDFVINGTFIFGGASENEDDILDIIKFSKKIGIDYAAYYILEIHPGTRIFDIAKEQGLVQDILDSYIEDDKDYPLFTNKNLDKETLMELQCEAYRKFYFDTDHIASLIEKTNSVSTIYQQYEHIFEHAFIKGIR